MIGRDTIAAIATPPGIGGIGVIRISGTAAEGIARRLFRAARPLEAFLSHHLYHGEIVAPETGAVLDDVLVTLMKGPHTYTGEDTLEINCHGGPMILRTVLAEVVQAGARPAARGEFTKRAFLNGRLDLSQAEAVLDMITAKTPEGAAAAVNRRMGKLSGRIEAIRNAVINLLAGIEAAIDFAEDDGVVEATGTNLPAFQAVIDDLHSLAATYRRGRLIREGISVVIAGRPNVGKSSLLNRILGEKRAIVNPIPGTTRDFIEETVNIGGIPVRLTDTAGIHDPENSIEKEGIDLLWERLVTADVVLLLLDGSMALTPVDREVLVQMQARLLIPVINKSDLPQQLDEKMLRDLLPEGTPATVRISAKYGDGIDRLTEAIHEMILATPAEEMPAESIADLRHKVALEKAAECLGRARKGLYDGLPSELAALEVREALDSLGEITGRTTSEEVLDRIFANFCVGK
ncbi:MAG: tRNA uridine-5-carboxymethylaminomethyl(34) synthesis GTPase MnmE [Deltaproteobacteria bacterium]|nr:tRNA uridine-5-carboxymethylaminomethyl(34) synthesis GTPase MnmE [Deltaproteobacteria bacterium]